MPERVAVVVTGESLVNDGVGLTIYRAAVGAATAGAFSLGSAALSFVVVAAGGIAIGLAVGWVLNALKRRVQETEIEITLSLFTPYAAYIAAEHAGVSGVLAAVAVGVYSGWRSSEVLMPETRVKVQAFWTALAFLLDSMLFVLVGLQLPVVLDALAPRSLGGLRAARARRRRRGDGGAHGVRARARRDPRAPAGHRRGAAAARRAARRRLERDARGGVARGGARDPARHVRARDRPARHVRDDPRDDRRPGADAPADRPRVRARRGSAEDERREQEARLQAAEAALRRLDEAGAEDEAPDTTVERLRTTYTEHAERAANELGDRDVETEDSSEAYAELRAMTLAAERDAIMQLRREGKLSGDAARRLQHELDLAESRLRS